jgi:hypothetical protein
LAEALRETIRQIGPCTGLEAWSDYAHRIARCGAVIPQVQLIGFDVRGLPRIRRADLDAALLEAEAAGGITCRNLRESGADEVYTRQPIAVLASGPVERQRVLFAD